MSGSGCKNVVEFDPLLPALHSNGHLFNTPILCQTDSTKETSKQIFLPCKINRTLSQGSFEK